MAPIVLVVQLMALLLRLMMCALLVVQIHALGLDEAVGLSTGQSSEELLGELVRDGLALVALLILEGLMVSFIRWLSLEPNLTFEAGEGCSSCYSFVGEFGFIWGVVIGVVGLLVVVVGVAYRVLECGPGTGGGRLRK